MEVTDETIEKMIGSIGDAIRKTLNIDCNKVLHTNTRVNRGILAGTIRHDVQPGGTLDEWDVLQIVKRAYEINGAEIDHSTREGEKAYRRVETETIKYLCSLGYKVVIVGRLLYEAKVESTGRPYWWTCACNHDFNTLDSTVEPSKSPSLIHRKQKEAKRKPFDHPQKVQSVMVAGRDTYVTCDKCGNTIRIEHTEDRAA